MKQESLLMGWRISLQFLSLGHFCDVFRDFGRTCFVILKYFSIAIALLTFAILKGFNFPIILIFFVAPFIFLLAAQSPDKKTKFSYFLKSMPLFFRWLLLVLVAGFFGTIFFWIGLLAGAMIIASASLLLGKAMGLTISAISFFCSDNQPMVIVAGLIILPYYLSVFYIPILSQLFFLENKYKGIFRSVKQGMRLSVYFLPLWLFISALLIFLFLAVPLLNQFFKNPIGMLVNMIWLGFCYLFWVSIVATFYRKIQAHVLSLKEI